MNKTNVITSLLMFLLMTTIAWGVSTTAGKWQSPSTVLILDTRTRLDVNNLEMFVYNDGNFAYDNANILGKTDGLYFPRGTKKTVIYSAGLWVGAKVGDETRLAIAEYSSEYWPGPMEDETFLPDRAEFKVYKINRGDNEDTNPDYANWPEDQGAPVDDEGRPKLIGDQMCWTVFNDANPLKHINDAANTKPLGIEVQMTSFGYARGGALGNTLFLKYTIINKGGNRLDSTFVSLWADPDLGNASDDLVGCDTILSLGYCYNEGADSDYGAAPPAVGFDFFQGPIVPGAAEDSALVSGQWRKGYKNLPMTSFNKYINGTDPRNRVQTYNYMKGLTPQGDPVIDPVTGEVTNYFVSGNPVTGTGWIDEASADRRYMMSSGPFTMEPGDTQEVVAAVLVGQGSNPLTSIDALKEVSRQAQAVFDLNFDIPSPPPSPSVYLRGLDRKVEIIWGSEPVGSIEASDILGQEFHFEGFNLYQGESATGPWHKFATFDNDHDEFEVGLIYNDIVDPAAGGTQRIIVQKGSNSGLTYNMTLTTNQLTGAPLRNNQPYYFAVTAYSYDINNVEEFLDPQGNFLGHMTEVLESPIVAYSVKPYTHLGNVQTTATHTSGSSDGVVYVEYIYPDRVTGNEYEVTFNEDLSWNLRDLTLNQTKLSEQTNQADNYDYSVVDGLMFRVVGPLEGIAEWSWQGTRWMSGVDWGGRYFFGGMDNGTEFFGSNITPSEYVDVEVRFSWTETQKAHLYVRGGTPNYGYQGFFDCPFTVWDVSATPHRQLNVCFVENAGSGCDDQTWLPCTESGVAEREYLFIMNSTYTGNPHPEYVAQNLLFDAEDMDILYAVWPRVRPGHDPVEELEDGQKFIITAAKPNLPTDRFRYTSQKPATAGGDDVLVGNTLADVKTVPNPYYGFYPEEIDQFDRIIKFINLPAVPMTIRIYNLAGDLLRTMRREGSAIFNPEFIWNLKTESGQWVASGIYVWVIEAEGLGTRFGKMAVFPEEEQLITY